MWIGIVMTVLMVMFALLGVGIFLGRHHFATRLKKEVPAWVEQGWMEKPGGDAILASLNGASKHHISTTFSILGVLLFGAGVITFVASNWDEISKLTKLAILFGSIWATFAAALWCRLRELYVWLSEAVLLLGVILFGVNIMLIAQIYHIDAHYPDGVLAWALGALLVAWLMQSKPVFVASVLLVMLWTGMEAFDFREFHWQFMLVWGLQVALLIRCDWRGMTHLMAMSFLLWSGFSFFSITTMTSGFDVIYLMQSYFIFYLILFLLGMHLLLSPKMVSYGEIIQKYAVVVALACFYTLTFPHNGSFSGAPVLWFWVTALLLVVLASLALWHRKRALQQHTRQDYHIWGLALLGVTLLLILVNMTAFSANPLFAIAFNIVYSAMLIWLIFFGMRTGNSLLVNISFLFFAITLLSRYFDTFWQLLDRSLFFMAGGVLLVALGIILEKKRRKVVAGIANEGKAAEQRLS